MLKFLVVENLLTSLQNISPPMLILSVALHGILLSIPVSSSFLGKSKLSIVSSKNEVREWWFSSHSDTEIFNTTKMLVKPRPPEMNSDPIASSSMVSQLPIPLPTPTMELGDPEVTKNLKVEVEIDKQQQDSMNQEDIDVWETKTSGNYEDDVLEENITEDNAAQPMTQPTPDFDSPSHQNSTVLDSKVSHASKSTNLEQSSVDSVPGSSDQFKMQTSESLLHNSDQEIFDSIFVSLQEELVFTANLDFAEPNKFTIYKVGLEDIFGTTVGKTPNEVALLVKNKLEKQGFQFSLIGIYGGGPLYEVKKGEFIRYLSFAPTINKTEAIIVSWRTAPI
jgi:hypothetical protein